MVRVLHVSFDDDEFEALSRRRKELGLDWRSFVLTLIPTMVGVSSAEDSD